MGLRSPAAALRATDPQSRRIDVILDADRGARAASKSNASGSTPSGRSQRAIWPCGAGDMTALFGTRALPGHTSRVVPQNARKVQRPARAFRSCKSCPSALWRSIRGQRVSTVGRQRPFDVVSSGRSTGLWHRQASIGCFRDFDPANGRRPTSAVPRKPVGGDAIFRPIG